MPTSKSIKVKWSVGEQKPWRKVTNSQLRKYFSPTLIKTRDRAWKHYKTIVRSWKSEHKPKFVRRTGFGTYSGGKSLFSAVGIETGSTPLAWLEAGTKVRRRRMSPNWVSKTTPNHGIAPQRKGAGWAMRIWGYYPGIKARNFRDGIIDDIAPEFYSEMETKFSQLTRALW